MPTSKAVPYKSGVSWHSAHILVKIEKGVSGPIATTAACIAYTGKEIHLRAKTPCASAAFVMSTHKTVNRILPSRSRRTKNRSETAWVYQVGMLGLVRKLQMAEIPEDCLGSVGPDDIAAWSMMLDFQEENPALMNENKTWCLQQVVIRVSLCWITL